MSCVTNYDRFTHLTVIPGIGDIAGRCTGTFRKLDIPNQTVFNSVKSIFIAEGNVRISEMLTLGMKNQKSLAEKKRLATGGATGLVNWEQEVYERMYVVASNVSGMEQLEWLATHSFEDWIAETDAVCGEISGMVPASSAPEHTRLADNNGWAFRWIMKETGVPCLYMPIAEIKLLHGISIETEIEEFAAICPERLINAVREGTRKKLIPLDTNGKEVEKKERKPKKDPAERKKFRRQRMHRTSLELTTQEIKALKTAAIEANLSVNGFVRKMASKLADEQKEKEGEK